MNSPAFGDLMLGVREVRALRGFPPVLPLWQARQTKAEARIAHRRACVVLLCSHYERYIYSLNESAVDFINQASVNSSQISLPLRLLQVRSAIDRLAETAWDKREDQLLSLFSQYATHWNPSATISGLDPVSNLEWMKSPKVAAVKRYFRYFDVEDIVRAVTRTDGNRRTMERQLQALVDARNGIAHGDQNIQPSSTEVSSYLETVEKFCGRADKLMAQCLGNLARTSPPW